MPTSTSTTVTGVTPGTSASVTLTESDPGPAPMVVGTTVTAADFGHLLPGRRDHGSRFCRTFSSPGDQIVDWANPRRRLPPGVADFHSFKDWPSDSVVVQWLTRQLDTMPASLLAGPPLLPELTVTDPDGYAPDTTTYDGLSVLLCWKHEGEPDCIAADIPIREWRRRHQLAYRTVRQHPNGRRVGYIPIQTGTWTEAKSAKGKAKGDWDPLSWWPGAGDYAGYDAYNLSDTTGEGAAGMYRDPVEFLTVPALLAAGSGRRLFLPELGVVRQGDPPEDGTHRAVWIRAVVAELRRVGAAGVAWWDAMGTGGRDFRLEDEPSRLAWREALAVPA